MTIAGDLEVGPWPVDDFSAYGPVETKKLPRRQQLVGSCMHTNWLRIPHVFHQDQADLTSLEEYRQALNSKNPSSKLTLLPFLIKATAKALHEYPKFNASLAKDGSLVLKKYFHIGVAVDTPDGLLVPVLKNCNTKNVDEIASELQQLSHKAVEKGLSINEMSGGCMTISSLGHIGGTGFTPIINAPEVAILGVSRASWTPVSSRKGELDFRYCVPLSLSYDHRVINGADAARFCRRLSEILNSSEELDQEFFASDQNEREVASGR